MKMIFFWCFVIVFATGCGADESGDRKDGYSRTAETPEDSLFQEVMHGHDEAMAKMGRIAGYRKQVDQKLDSLKKTRKRVQAGVARKYEELKSELQTAEEQMNQWMHDFSIDSAQGDPERRMQYLKDEKIKVDKVRDDIFRALGRADSLINQKTGQ